MKVTLSTVFALLTFFIAVHTAPASISIIEQENQVGETGTGPIYDTGAGASGLKTSRPRN